MFCPGYRDERQNESKSQQKTKEHRDFDKLAGKEVELGGQARAVVFFFCLGTLRTE